MIENDPGNKIDALQKIGCISAVTRIVLTFRRAGVENIYLISNQNETVKKEIAKMGVTFIPASYHSQHMFLYVKTGLKYLQNKEDYLFIMPSSFPLFTTETLDRLSGTRALVSIPFNQGISGCPVFISTRVIPSILEYKGEQGLDGALKSLSCDIDRINVEDSGIRICETDNQDFFTALDKHSLNRWNTNVKVSITKEKAFFGPGARQLLTLVKEIGSLSLACDYMGMSYSKGRTMIYNMETQLGFHVLERKQGGETGGSSQLTEKGLHLLKQYEEYEKKVKKYAQDIFPDFFGEYL